MQLNLATLVMLDIYILTLVGVLMLHAWSRGRDTTLGYLSGGLLVGALGTLIGSLREMNIDWLPIVFGNVLILLSAALAWTSLRVFAGRRPSLMAILAGPALWALLCIVPAFYASLPARIAVGSLLMAIYAGLGAWELWRRRRVLEVDVRPALLLASIHMSFYVLRAFFDSNLPFASNGQSTPFFTLVVLETLLYVIGLAFVTLAMVKERAELRYKSAALRDPLTGIGNRRAFVDAAELQLAECARRHLPAVLLLCDLDHFKRLNDNFGHAAGDQALAEFGRILAGRSRQQDLCARIGGEEFVCLLTEADAQAGLALAERIRREFAELPFVAEGQLSVSIGVALAQGAGHELTRLLSQADQALYAAKAAGRNRVELYRAEPRLG
ncbi:GGDEF domain-containing protein [Pseudomonas sp. Gutcm_11s]|uniref:GGDEF domain-containing protein n=1 Tax=Pseudomonas sp. Gutcm_11s TaxID=3026088 RepID=UPI00235E6541|nr:GGDEF domain-containing protein [Pseudomonas sp. Gutcm_11s]MDD0841832.1 GGDEF domain-containing protein [Pseudomonas sp. Gutcm_11s]